MSNLVRRSLAGTLFTWAAIMCSTPGGFAQDPWSRATPGGAQVAAAYAVISLV